MSTTPTFDEILVADSLAVVRLRWATVVRDAAAWRTSRRWLRDLQPGRRERDGRWMLVRGTYARDSTAAPLDAPSAGR